MKYKIPQAGSMIGALVTGEHFKGVRIVVEYKCDAKGEWIRFIKDPPDHWWDISTVNIVSKKERT